jgi:hypothetical protein
LGDILDKPKRGIMIYIPVLRQNKNTYSTPRFSNLSFKVMALATVTPSKDEPKNEYTSPI